LYCGISIIFFFCFFGLSTKNSPFSAFAFLAFRAGAPIFREAES